MFEFLHLRRAAERFSRGFTFRRTLPKRYGGATLYVSPEGGLRYWGRIAQSDPVLLNAAAEFVGRGDTVWDIGANIGLFTFAAAGLAGPEGRVVAVEPDTWCVDLLRRSISLNDDHGANVMVIPAALGGELGVTTFNVAKRSRSASYLDGHGGPMTGGQRERHQVVQLTLDWLLEEFGSPNIVKIDVELAELAVLRGATELLTHHRPILLLEVDGINQSAATEILGSYGYGMYDAAKQRRVRESLAPYNTIALPS